MANSGISGLLNISRSALLTNSQAIRVVGNNIANVNTPGYSRRKAELQALVGGSGTDAQFGTGVTISGARRIIDQFINRYYQAGLNDRGQTNIREELLSRAEAPFALDNPEGSVGYKLSEFFSAIDDLAVNPSDAALRQNLIQKGQTLGQSVRTTFNTLASLQREADERVADVVGQVNTLTAQLAETNSQIRNSRGTGSENPGLLDQRDALIEKISEKISVTAVEQSDGTASLFLSNGFSIVSSVAAKQLSFDRSPTTVPPVTYPVGLDASALGHIVYDFDESAAESHFNLTAIIANGGGELAGLLQVRGVQATTDTSPFQARGDIVEAAARIEAITRDLLTRFNLTNLGPSDGNTATAAFDPSAVALDGTNPAVYGLFSATGVSDTNADGLPNDLIANATYSRTFDLAISDPDKIAAAWDTNLAAPAIAFAVGDNRNLLALSALRADSVIYTLGNFSATTSIEGLYEEGISYLGSLASTAKSNNIVASDKVNQIRNLKLDVSGVSTDEEFTNLISFQKAYQGSARLVKMADDLLAEILNLL